VNKDYTWSDVELSNSWQINVNPLLAVVTSTLQTSRTIVLQCNAEINSAI